MKIFGFYILLLILGMFFGCSSGKILSNAEKSKLDPALQRLFSEENDADQDLNVSVLEDGTRLYGIIIKSDDPEKLKENGIPTNSVSGNIVTARLTVEQIRKAIALSSVQYIESGSTNYPK